MNIGNYKEDTVKVLKDVAYRMGGTVIIGEAKDCNGVPLESDYCSVDVKGLGNDLSEFWRNVRSDERYTMKTIIYKQMRHFENV